MRSAGRWASAVPAASTEAVTAARIMNFCIWIPPCTPTPRWPVFCQALFVAPASVGQIPGTIIGYYQGRVAQHVAGRSDSAGRCNPLASPALPQAGAEALDALARLLRQRRRRGVGDAERRAEPDRGPLHHRNPFCVPPFPY